MVVQTVDSVGDHDRDKGKVMEIYSSILHESDEYLKCGLCWEVPQNTVTLSCSHNFCEWCFKNGPNTIQQSENSIKCPVCGVINDAMTQGQTDDVVTDNEQSVLDGKDQDRNCDLCVENRPGEARCVECKESMCNFCVQAHRRSKASKHHTIIMLDEHKAKDLETPLGDKCSHHDEDLAYFCRPCDAPVCKVCRATDHRGHRTRPVSVIVGDRRKQVEDKIETLQNGYVLLLERKLEDIPKQIQDMKENAESVVIEIIERAESIKGQMDAIKVEMIKDVHSKESMGIEKLEQFKTEVEKQLLTVKESIKRTQNVLKQGSDIEVVSTSKSSQEMLDSLETGRSLPKLQKLDVAFEKGELAMEMLKNGFGHCSTGNSGCTWSRSVSMCQGDPQDVNIKLVSEFHCPTVNTFNGNDDNDDDDNDDFLNESIQAMTGTSDGHVVICRGCESEDVIMSDSNGQMINNVRVGVHIDDLVSRDDHSIILSCFRDRSIKVIEDNGNVRQLVPTQYYPRGLTVTRDGSLLVCMMDQYSTSVSKNSRRMVVKLDGQGEQVQVYEYTDGSKRLFTRPYRVVENVNGDICVTDKTSMGSGRVVVLDSTGTLKFIYDARSLTRQERPFSPSGIVCDNYGRLLIADTNNHCVHIVDKYGQFASFLLRKEDGITCPTSLVLDKGQLWLGNENGQIKIYQYL